MDSFRLTDAYFPLVVSVMPPRIDVEMMRRYAERVEAIYARGQRFATLVDTTRMLAVPTSADRGFLADWQNRTVDRIRHYNVINVTVIDSVLMRGALTAMNWIFPPPNEQVVVATLDQGFRLGVDRLRRESLVLPPALERLASLGRPVVAADFFPELEGEGGSNAVDQNAAATASWSPTASSKSEKS